MIVNLWRVENASFPASVRTSMSQCVVRMEELMITPALQNAPELKLIPEWLEPASATALPLSSQFVVTTK